MRIQLSTRHNSEQRERESSSRSNHIYPSLADSASRLVPPPSAEGALAWVNTTSDTQARLATANANATHPQTPSAREGALRKPSTITLREGAYEATNYAKSSSRANFSRRGNPNTHTPKPSRKLALSLITASALGTASLELAIADCVVKYNAESSGNMIDCTGTVTANYLNEQLKNSTSYKLINLGRGPDASSLTVIGDGTQVSFTANNNVIFRSVYAPDTSFSISGNGSAGVLVPFTRGNHAENGSTLQNLTISGTLNNISWASQEVYREYLDVDIHSGTQILGKLTFGSGSKLEHGMAIFGGYKSDDGSIGDRSTFVNSIENNGTIPKLHLGYHQFAGDFASLLGSYKIEGSGTIQTLNVYQATLSINSNADNVVGKNGRVSSNLTKWNDHKHNDNDGHEHISFQNFTTTSLGTIGEGAIRINIGEGVTDDTQKYLYKNLILGTTGGVGDKITYSNLRAGLGTAIHDKGDGFTLSADVATSYGSSMWRTLSLSYARRNIMVSNILDTMTTKTFHSDRYYNQEVELRLLQYDLSRLTNRSSKFAKHTRKNQKAIDKTRNKLARLTLEQSKGQNLDKGYNNFELIDQLDAIFIPYTGRRDWRVFLVPYAAHSYADMGASTATEWAGGAIGGVQRNLRSQGILTGYLAYEYAHATTEMLGAQAIMQTNALQGGLSYFKIFPIIGKVWEAHIKANGRVGVDMPLLSAQSPLPNIKFNLVSNKKEIATPLMWSLGAEVRGGLTFYQFKSNSYVSPEIGLSYDVLSPVAMKLEKAKYGLGGNEYYDAQYWHLPQLSASVKYYKVFGNTFRTNITAGLRYNILNKPLAHFRIGGLEGEGEITLPAVYGNLALDAIWVVKKNHELSAGYSGVFFANKFGKNVMDKFNGVSTAINLKYAYWFGGTDYVTDAEGNAISRKVAENKKSKKSKKPKKKPKKSKKKVYYIDG